MRAHQGAVRAFLRRLTGEHARADELAQDTFLLAYRKRAKVAEVQSVRSWLYRLAYRRFLDDCRKSARRHALAPELELDGEREAGAAVSTGAAHPGARLDIARAMDALPPARRACALLCLALGHTHADAATITGLPLGTVKSHVARARAVLRESLHEYQ